MRRKKMSSKWTSFVASPVRGRAVRGLEEEGNPRHRVRVEHNRETLLVHVSDEDGKGWTTLAIDRPSRGWAVAQERQQLRAATGAYEQLYAGARGGDGA